MERFVAGTVVVVLFPFSDLSNQKRRPALVLADAEFGNVILCQITSKAYSSSRAIELELSGFKSGGLPVTSYIRFDKLFTADPEIIFNTVGKVRQEVLTPVLKQIQNLFRS